MHRFAALLMTLFPPSITRYTREGTGFFTITTAPTAKGKVWGQVQCVLSYLGPGLLGLSFGLQLLAILAQPAKQ